MAMSSTPDSFDPGNTYYAYVLDFDNLFTMPLFTYKSCPGTCSAQLVPDLATDMGTVSNNGLTYTVHIQPNVKFEDGTVVTSQDVKYGIERTYDRTVAANGPTYYQALLTDPKYPGPYKDRSKNLMGLTAIDTPNATTLVFHLQAPYPDLPYVLAFPSSSPVPPAQGHRQQLPAASDVHRAVHVLQLPAEQAAHARAEPELEPGVRPVRPASWPARSWLP